MPILNRTSLNPSDKLDLLAKTIACQDKQSISSLSREFNISRKSVRRARFAINTALDDLVSTTTEPDCITTVDVDTTQLRRMIVALSITAPNSIRAIQELIPLMYPGCKVSYGYIQGVIIEAQEQAVVFNRTVPLTNIKTIALDEMFSQGSPVLAGICLDSGFLFSLSHESQRDGETWANVLNEAVVQGMQPEHVVKDGAKGIAKGVELTFDLAEQRDDAFHAVYLAGKAVFKLEQRAYRCIGIEAKASDTLAKTKKDNRKSLAKSLYWASDKCTKAIARYTSAERAFRKIRRTFCSINFTTGELLTPEAAERSLKQAIVLLRDTEQRDCLSVATYLENRVKGLTLATTALYKDLVELQKAHPAAAISLACRFFEIKRKLKKMDQRQRQQAKTEMLASYHLLYSQLDSVKADSLMQKIEQMLASRHMASSAIEGFNATLRSYLYVRKGVNQGFLELFKAWHNLRKRRWGRHQGTSAYESMTGKTVNDWLSILGFPGSHKTQ